MVTIIKGETIQLAYIAFGLFVVGQTQCNVLIMQN